MGVLLEPEIRTLATPFNRQYWKTWGVYGICNLINGKWYIGSSSNIGARITCHISHLKCGRHGNHHLQAAYIKYGPNAFTFEILSTCPNSPRLLIEKENWWMKRLNSVDGGYNQRKDAENNFGIKQSKETQAKRGKALQDFYASHPESCQYISRRMLGTTNRAMPFSFINKDGVVFTGKNLKLFCKQHGLSYCSAHWVKMGRMKEHRGFKRYTISCT